MPLSRRAQRSARVVALGAAALGLGPRTRPPAPVLATVRPRGLRVGQNGVWSSGVW